MQVSKPNLNRGLSAGVKQESFGNFRDSNFRFPDGLSKSQPPPTPLTNPPFTYKYAILPTENNWDMRWDVGTLLFVKKDDNALKQMYCLSYARTLMMQSGINHHLAKKSLPSSSSTTSSALVTKPRARDYNFMGTMEDIVQNLEFAGVGIGPVEPGLQIGTADMTTSMKYSGNSKQVPFVAMGRCFVPNLWECQLRAGQDLYIGIKPRKIKGGKSYNELGDPKNVPTGIEDYHTCPDFFFYTHPANRPPPYCTDQSKALDEAKGNQPPLTDRAYIDWTVTEDSMTKVKTYEGEIKDAIVWKIGRVYRLEQSRNTVRSVGTSRIYEKSQEPLSFEKDYRTYPMIEIQLDPTRVY
jgi:hypothetical protein